MSPPAAFVGTNRFEVRALLGEGATGRVYRVLDRETSRDVALKTLRLPAAEALYRLKREFRARAGLSHPNLLQLYELFAEDDRCFFTMEALEGVDFLRWARGTLGMRGATLEVSSASLEGPAPQAGPAPVPVPLVPSPDAPRHEAAGTQVSWERLRQGLDQLLQALQALHATGLVHRDVKPANVLVTPRERVVLLDFGLTTGQHAPGAEPPRSRRLVGTPAYMAPEQVSGGVVTPAADLYAVGALLYEVLTGAPPFALLGGSPLEHKLSRQPPHVLELAPHAPGELAALAMELLVLDPARRPGAEACRARLALDSGEPPLPVAMATRASSLFVGRTHELEVLTRALAEVADQGRQVTVHLHGPSGIGKSTLVRHFLAQSGARAPVVLQGRCHPQESVPYKALDASIDSLARHLETLPAAAALALVPARASALTRLFPVLGRLAAFQHVPALVPLPDATELRRQGALALRELLERLARGPRPLVLWIDDVQWGDSDSALLFEELLRPPAPPLLLLLSWRSEARDGSPLLPRLLGLAPPGEGAQATARELRLGALPAHQVGALASALLDATDASPQVRAVIAQAEGNPFIARELAHHARMLAARSGPEAPGLPQVDVARLVVERIQALPEEQRALLEVASLAGRPLARGIALRAAGLDESGRVLVASLRDSGLLREVPGQEEPGIGAYHDRIREALLGALPAESRARRHRAVAEALTARGSEDDEALLLHWEGAGEPLRAGHHAVRSAERATRALAFEHAAALYRKGLELLGPLADRPTLLERLAEALANLGRAEEAALHYLEATRALGGELTQTRVRDLKRRAAEQYLKSGRFDEGWREMHAVLRALDVPIPGSFGSAVWSATWRRLLFMTRRVDLEAPASAVRDEERHRLEVLWTASTSWVMVNPMLSDAFRTQHLLEARRLGETHLCRALTLEATMQLHVGGRWMEASARRLLGKVRERMERTGEPYDRAWYGLALANQGYTLGRWREVVEAGEHAAALFREHCPGSDWERVTLAIFHHHALAMRGELRALASRLEAFHREAVQRGDLHARCETYLGEPVVAWLARDRAEEARAQAREAMAAQSPRTATWPENAYRRQQFAHLIATVYTAHYHGEPWPAWRAVLEEWAALSASFMLMLRATGLNLRHMRARAALAAAATLPTAREAPPEGVDRRWRKPALLADVRAQVRVIDRDALGCARPIGALLRAGLAWQEADVAEARRRLEEAVAGFEREDMALYREAARYALGAVRGGDEGRALRRQAREWMEAEGVVRPGALAAALVPGLSAWPEALPAQLD